MNEITTYAKQGVRLGLIAMAAVLLAAGSASALTATYALSSSGGTGILPGNAIACTSLATCQGVGGTHDFDNILLAGASGTLAIVDSGTAEKPTGTLDLLIPSLTVSGAGVGGIDEIILSGLSGSFSFPVGSLQETDLGGGLFQITQIPPPATATFTGTVEGRLAGGTVFGPTAFSETVSLSVLNCIVAPGQCGTQLDFTSVVDGNPLEFRVTANLNAVIIPEAGLAALLGVSMACIGFLRRRH